MDDLEKAIADISDIRARLAATTRFRGYAPEAVAVAGVVSALILLAQMVWPQELAANDRQLALTWGLVLVAACFTTVIEAFSRAHRQQDGMAAAMLRGALRVVGPITAVQVATGFAVLAFAPGSAWILPGLWQMLIGVAVFASHATMPRGIGWPGLWYLASGAAVLGWAGANGALTPLMCGGPLVVGHLAIAWLLKHKEAQA